MIRGFVLIVFSKTMFVLMGFFFIFIFLELIFQFFPVSTGGLTMPLNKENSVVSYEPGKQVVCSNWNFDDVRKYHINNKGFFNRQDYVSQNPLPLVAIIGDSYVEAQQVSQNKSFYALLDDQLGKKFRFYTFARSFAPLSQYLNWTKYAVDTFNPSKLIFVIIGNDFDESLYKYNPSSGYRFVFKNEKLINKRFDYEPSLLKKVIRNFALPRYFVFNLKGREKLQQIFSRTVSDYNEDLVFAGNTHRYKSDEVVKESKKVVNHFLKAVIEISQLDSKKILFIVDGIRPSLYFPDILKKDKKSYFGIMRDYFINEATLNNFSLIDMQPIMVSEFKNKNQKFEFTDDFHWNEIGHSIVAEAIINSNFINQ